MSSWFKARLFQFLILGLSIFRPNILFERINKLGWYKNALRQWAEDQNLSIGSKVLEVGCATGTLSAAMAHMGYKMTGVDYSHRMIEDAKNKYKGISYLEADVLDLPFKTGEFDAVIAASLINIIDNKEQCIIELTRSCKTNGVVSILVPSDEFGDKDLRLLVGSHQASGFSEAAMKAWHNQAPKLKTSDILFLFKNSGFKGLKIKKYLQGMVISVSGIKGL